MNDIFTIGYSGFLIEDFINNLKRYNINALIDVRSNPYSKFFLDYNRANLERTLQDNGIIYRNYKIEFGAQQEDMRYFTNDYLDFDKYTKSKAFLEGVRKIEEGIRSGYTFAFMCAEKDPSICHRNIMVARRFYKLGYNIKNLLSDGSCELQEELEARLVEQYFPDRDQISMFSNFMPWEDMVEKSYEYRNMEIGHRIHEIEANAL